MAKEQVLGSSRRRDLNKSTMNLASEHRTASSKHAMNSDPRPARASTDVRAIEFAGHELAVPGQDGVGAAMAEVLYAAIYAVGTGMLLAAAFVVASPWQTDHSKSQPEGAVRADCLRTAIEPGGLATDAANGAGVVRGRAPRRYCNTLEFLGRYISSRRRARSRLPPDPPISSLHPAAHPLGSRLRSTYRGGKSIRQPEPLPSRPEPGGCKSLGPTSPASMGRGGTGMCLLAFRMIELLRMRISRSCCVCVPHFQGMPPLKTRGGALLRGARPEKCSAQEATPA
jgi:hypothetical protein